MENSSALVMYATANDSFAITSFSASLYDMAYSVQPSSRQNHVRRSEKEE